MFCFLFFVCKIRSGISQRKRDTKAHPNHVQIAQQRMWGWISYGDLKASDNSKSGLRTLSLCPILCPCFLMLQHSMYTKILMRQPNFIFTFKILLWALYHTNIYVGKSKMCKKWSEKKLYLVWNILEIILCIL